MTVTTLIAIFKNEKDNRLEDNHIKLNTFQSYKLLWNIIKMPSIKILAIALLTMMVSMSIIKTKFKFFLPNIRLNKWPAYLLIHLLPVFPNDKNGYISIRNVFF